MIRTTLEGLFEAGFYGLGRPLGERVYLEQLRATAHMARQMRRDPDVGELPGAEDILGASSEELSLTLDDESAFTRTLQLNDEYKFVYSLDPDKPFGSYRSIMDEVISSGNLRLEMISIQSEEDSLYWSLNHVKDETTITLYPDPSEDQAKPQFAAAARKLEELQGQPYDPMAVYKIFMNLILQELR